MPRPTFAFPARHVLPAILCTLFAAAAPVDALEGRLQLTEQGRDRTARESRHAVIWIEPAAPPADAVAPLPEQTMSMQRKEFTPRVLIVTPGTTVRFPNRDPILHNVFSVSGRNRFDLGLYRRGDGEAARFEHPGIVRVFCNVHHAMVAYVAVVDTPFYAVPDDDGGFRFPDLPPGRAKVTVWHERADPMTTEIEAPTGPLDLTLQLTKPRVPRHRNKFGKPYSRRRGKAY